MTTIKSFVERLAKIGINVELSGNYPWVYLERVNGINIYERFFANHGFTVFFQAIRPGEKDKITDITKIFNKIREIVINGKEEYTPDEDYNG